jgi:hypothetical protein
MQHSRSRRALAIVALATGVAFAASADAAPISKCNAAKKKCIGKYVAAVLGCHAKAEGKGVAVASACVSKAVAKITGGGKGCFDKNDAKVGNDCSTTGNAPQQLAEADALIADVVKAVDPAYPTPTLTKCGAARKKCAGKKAAGLLACAAKANKDGNGDPACAPKVSDKFGGAKGCDVNALVKGSDCLGTATTAELETRIDAYRDAADFSIDYVGPPCGDGLIEPGEFCDPNGLNNPQAQCGTDFACVGCNCACPTRIHFVGLPNDPATQLDVGWTGLAHRSPIVSNGDVTVAVSGCAGSTRPCGQCNLSGPIPNVGAGELESQRCTNDTSIQCTTDAPCLGGGGTCQFYFGTPLALSSGGVGTCVVNQFASPLIGTANIESGESYSVVLLQSSVFTGPTDNPCPRCLGDATINDGVQGGTCIDGPRGGLACDGNGTVPSRPDFGVTSLDCPPPSANNVANLSIDLSNGTDPIVKTLSATSPNCGDGSGQKCLCETCNNATADPCSSNADCLAVGATVCGGRRCFGGPNNGGECNNNSACPGGGLCARAGQPSQPSACLDDSSTPGVFDCSDTAPVDQEGECIAGPVTKTCSVASGHGQRACGTNDDCGGGAGTCQAANRACFLTGGFTGTVGTNTLIGNGVEDPASLDVSKPILASVYCVAPTAAAAVNVVAGLPGPSRLTLRGVATGHP